MPIFEFNELNREYPPAHRPPDQNRYEAMTFLSGLLGKDFNSQKWGGLLGSMDKMYKALQLPDPKDWVDKQKAMVKRSLKDTLNKSLDILINGKPPTPFYIWVKNPNGEDIQGAPFRDPASMAESRRVGTLSGDPTATGDDTFPYSQIYDTPTEANYSSSGREYGTDGYLPIESDRPEGGRRRYEDTPIGGRPGFDSSASNANGRDSDETPGLFHNSTSEYGDRVLSISATDYDLMKISDNSQFTFLGRQTVEGMSMRMTHLWDISFAHHYYENCGYSAVPPIMENRESDEVFFKGSGWGANAVEFEKLMSVEGTRTQMVQSYDGNRAVMVNREMFVFDSPEMDQEVKRSKVRYRLYSNPAAYHSRLKNTNFTDTAGNPVGPVVDLPTRKRYDPNLSSFVPVLTFDLDHSVLMMNEIEMYLGNSLSIPSHLKLNSHLSMTILDDENKRWRRWLQNYSENLFDLDTSSVIPYKNGCIEITLVQYTQEWKVISHKTYICTLRNYQNISNGAGDPGIDLITVEWSIVGEIDHPLGLEMYNTI